eukprot:333958-Chlamydomonas_euryale.AAC.2
MGQAFKRRVAGIMRALSGGESGSARNNMSDGSGRGAATASGECNWLRSGMPSSSDAEAAFSEEDGWQGGSGDVPQWRKEVTARYAASWRASCAGGALRGHALCGEGSMQPCLAQLGHHAGVQVTTGAACSHAGRSY